MPPDPQSAPAPSPRPAPPSLLGGLKGERPEAPAWFTAALADAPERLVVTVEGAAIEVLAWGRRGDPGLLLLHGMAAHADWWSFIAPFLAAGRRVVAPSWSGMGGSGWREHYDVEIHAREAMHISEALGLFEGGEPPLIVGHSYGSFVTLALAHRHGGRFKAVVLADGPISSEPREALPPPDPARRHRVYPSLDYALARFRFTPPQACEHLYIVDHIARTSLREAVDDKGRAGWTWRFDPNLRARTTPWSLAPLLAAPGCPLAIMIGGRSSLMTPERLAFKRATAPAGSPWVEIPEAGHHLMVDQPLAFVAGLRGLLAGWPQVDRGLHGAPLAAGLET